MNVQLGRSARSIFLMLNGSLLLLAAACSQVEGRPPAEYDFVRVMWNDDPSTTATVGWTSSGQTTGQQIHFGTQDYGTDFKRYEQTAPISATSEPDGDHHAFVRLKGLTPKTRYHFVISNGTTVSRHYWFQTASNSPSDRISIIAGGDSRNNRGPRKNANRLVALLRPDAVMFGGDYTEGGGAAQWRDWFADWQITIADDGRVTPLIATRGNHETSDQLLRQLFDTPAPAYYAVTLGGTLARIYTLNSEISIAGSQTTWLKNDLSSQTTTFKLAQYHSPMRPHVSTKGNGENQYRYWAPLFQEHKMNLVVECDAHDVKQTWPLVPSDGAGNSDGFIRDDARGTVYVGEGGWGAPLRKSDKARPWTRDNGSFNHVQWIWIDASHVEVRTINTGSIFGVPSLTDANRFQVPAELNLWRPSNGDVVEITP